MRRTGWSAVCAALATLVVAGGGPTPQPPQEPLTVIETDGAATPLDAALILRATLRYAPKRISFYDPLKGVESQNLLKSKLGEAHIPVTFADKPVQPPADGSDGPTEGAGIATITLDRLLIRTERSERGEIGADLDGLFRGRSIVVAAKNGGALERLAAGREIPRSSPPSWVALMGVLLAATVPWWRLGVADRLAAGIGLGALWMLVSLALDAQCHWAMPVALGPLFPLLAWLSRGLNKSERRELPT